MCSISPYSNSLPPIVSGSSSPKVIPTNNYGSALQTDKANISQYSFKNSDVGIIAGATQSLDLPLDTTSGTSSNGTSLYVTPQSTFHPFSSSYPQPVIGTAGSVSKAAPQSYPQPTIPNPNLRFIAAYYQDHNKPNKMFTNTPRAVLVGNNTPVATTMEPGYPFPSVTSLQVALGVDDPNATSASDETNRPQKHSRNHESSTRKQSKAIKHRLVVDIEPINSDGSRKLKRQKGSSYSKNNIEHSETVELDGPSSIAHAFNNVATEDQSMKPAPSQLREKQATNTTTGISHAVHAYQGSAGTSDVVATGSKTRFEDTNNAEDEDNEDDEDITMETLIDTTDPACNHASLVSRKVWCWADKLKEIRRGQVESLFEETASIPAREVLELLKDIDECKNWATKGEVEDAQIEQLLEALVYRNGLEDGSEGSKLAVRILDNFAQRFRGVRYLPRRR